LTDDFSHGAANDAAISKLQNALREVQARHARTIEKLSTPTDEMMLAGALAHNTGLRPMRAVITAGEAKNIFIAMIAAMKEPE